MRKTMALMLAALSLLAASNCNTPDVERVDPVSGKLTGMDVSAPVTVVRDRYGVVHIEAENDEDMFYAVGYSMAQDRFMLMDMFRRAGGGTLSELIGSPARIMGVDIPHIDVLMRAFQFTESAEEGVARLDPESRQQIEAFTAGINQYLEDARGTISWTLTFDSEPEPWTVEDCFITSGIMGLTMNYATYLQEYYLERIRREQGEETRDFFVPHYPDDSVIITRDAPLMAGLPKSVFPAMFDGVGSNNWALSGTRTASGKPLLCNDPHVPHSITPTFWWHVHMKSDNYDVAGLMFSGFPYFGAATNGKIAWALTNVGMDYIDLWRERTNPDNPDQYLYDGKWEDFEKVPGTVEINGKKPLEFVMRKSRHGVVLEKDLLGWNVPAEDGEVIALRYVDMAFERFHRGYQEMALAEDYEGWLDGAEDMSWGPFAWNHTFADDQGNIAYWTTGHNPIRKDNQGWIARKGWDPDQDWQGYVPFRENPHMVNPGKGYIVTANNRVEKPGYPYYITTAYSGPSRAATISELIEKKDTHDVADMKRIQYDTSVYSARVNVPVILDDLEGARHPWLKKASVILNEWKDKGYTAEVDDRGVAIYELWKSRLTKAAFSDELGKGMMTWLSMSKVMDHAVEKIMHEPGHDFWDDKRTRKRETRTDINRSVIKDCMAYMYRNQGLSAKRWEWGKLSTLTLSPAFISVPGITSGFSEGPYPLPGTGESVQAANHVSLGPLGMLGFVGPSSHMIIDFRDPRRMYYNTTAGMADNPDSERFNNLMPYWLSGEYVVTSMEPDEYRDGMIGELVIVP